jgi:hypothetical protein
MSKITPALKNEITRQSDVTSKPLRDNFTNFANAINDNQDQIDAISTAASDNEVVIARGADHATLTSRLDSMWSGQPNYLKFGGVVTINGGDPQKVDVTAGEARVDGSDIIWSSDTSETIPFTSANTRFDVVVVNSATTTGGLHLEIVRGAESATPVLPAIAVTQKPLWVLTIGTASVALGWDARDQGCFYFDEGRWYYEWKIQDAIDALATGGDIRIGRGTYYETLTYDDNQTLTFEGGTTLKNAGGTTIVLGDVDLSGNTDTKILYDGGFNFKGAYDQIGNSDITGTLTVSGGIDTDGTLLKTRIINIGDWDMNRSATGAASVSISLSPWTGTDWKNIRNVRALIRNDADTEYTHLDNDDTNGVIDRIGPSNAIRLNVGTGGIFDTTDYNNGTSYNRGWVMIDYVAF